MAFTQGALDHVLGVASSGLVGEELVEKLAEALAVAADASSVSVFELEPRIRGFVPIGEACHDGVVEEEGVDELFWEFWLHSACAWTDPASPWFGRHPLDEPLDPERLYPTWRSYHETPMMLTYGREVGLGHEVVIPLESQPGRTRRVLVNRAASDPAFTDLDLTMLRLLQPHLDRAVRRAVNGVPARDRLSPRELEILSLVRAGHSTRDIAAGLWVQPSTVRKHLENVYAKLDVHGRTEAVAVVWGHPGVAEAAS